MMVSHLIDTEGFAKCGCNVGHSYETGSKVLRRSVYIRVANDGACTCRKCAGTAFKAQPVKIEGDLKGKIFHSSWGYDMTLNDYAIVVKQSENSITLQPLGTRVENDDGRGGGMAVPSIEPDLSQKPFTMRKVTTKYGSTHWTSAGGHYWSEWNEKPNYHNTWD